MRMISAQTWLAGVLILLSFPNAFAESDFSAFWKRFKSAVIAGDKVAVAEMAKFPLSMSYGIKAVKNKESFCVVMTKYSTAKQMPPSVLQRQNRKKSRRNGMRSTVRSKKLQTTGKTHRFASFLN